jgi:hypothetical protein
MPYGIVRVRVIILQETWNVFLGADYFSWGGVPSILSPSAPITSVTPCNAGTSDSTDHTLSFSYPPSLSLSVVCSLSLSSVHTLTLLEPLALTYAKSRNLST